MIDELHISKNRDLWNVLSASPGRRSAPLTLTAAPTADRLVPLLWPGRTVVCLASGPSLAEADVDVVKGKAPVIAVNAAIRLAPWADVFYSGAWEWWTPQAVKDRAWFTGLSVRLALNQGPGWNQMRPGVTPEGVIVLANTGDDGFETQPTGIKTYKNSGGAAINVAVHFGATRIILLGYDLQVDRHGRHHFHETGPVRHGSPYADFRRNIATMVPTLGRLGVEVINCTRSTALTCFPRQALEAIQW
jgi:hypothetical protein